MTNGNQSLVMTETAAAALDNNHRMAAYDKFQHDLLFNAFEYTSPSIWKRVKFLRELQSKHDELEARFFEEKAALEAKYQKFYQPFYDKRYEIVNGLVDVDGVSIKDVETEDDCEKGIPNFWLTAMKNNADIVDEIFEKDEGALGYLNNIKWSKTDDPKGFKLDFFFNTNPYFKNSVLTKIYHMIDEQEQILEKATGTEVEWYPGKCLTPNIKKEESMFGKLKDRESFFNFFNPPPIPARRTDIGDDTADKLKQQMEQDYDVGITIRDKIIPHAISWFTGEVRGIGYTPDDTDDDDNDNEYEDEGYFSEDSDEHGDKN